MDTSDSTFGLEPLDIHEDPPPRGLWQRLCRLLAPRRNPALEADTVRIPNLQAPPPPQNPAPPEYEPHPDEGYMAPECVAEVLARLQDAMHADALRPAGRVARVRADYKLRGVRWAESIAAYVEQYHQLPPG